MTSLRELALASRPLSWVNTGLPFLAAAVEAERGLSLPIVLGFAYFLVPFNLLMYGVNDIFDYASDLANPRKRSLEGGLVPPDRRTITWVAIAVTNVPLLLAILLTAPPLGTFIVLLAAGAAVVYSAPPLRTKERPIADSVTSASHFVLPAVAGFLIGGLAPGDLPWPILLGFFAWGMASHALGAIQDIEYDQAAGIASVATAFGAERTAAGALAGYSFAVLVALGIGGLATLAALAVASYLLLPLAILCRPTERQARRAWRSFLGLDLLVGFLLTQLLLVHWGVLRTTPGDVLVAVAIALPVACVAQLLATSWLLRASRRRAMERAATVRPRLPRLAVVVPCRDEAERIGLLISALASQDHPDLEIVVVDDGSSDGSAEVAARALSIARPWSGDRDRVITAPPLPAGWTGKAWACATGAVATSAGHLLFLDADTLPTDGALTELHAIALASKAGLVSGVTAYEMPTPAEQALLPGFPMTIFGLLPLWATIATRGRFRTLAFAYGPLMLADREAYAASGGHGAAPASEREDLDLARAIAGSGRAVRLVAAADLAGTRHYPGGIGALHAWRRVGLVYAGDSFAMLLATIAVSFGAWVLPLLVPLLGLAIGDNDLFRGGAVAAVALISFRVALAGLERQPITSVAFHPLTAVATLAGQVASLVDGVRGVPTIWRGRTVEPVSR